MRGRQLVCQIRRLQRLERQALAEKDLDTYETLAEEEERLFGKLKRLMRVTYSAEHLD